MAILIDNHTEVVIQGITGREGSRACREMKAYGTRVCAGVTPGKEGETVEGVPVYDTVARAREKHPRISASLVAVPAPFVRDAGLEAIEAGIPRIVILTEHVPTADTACLIAFARDRNARIIGPSSVGIISPGKAKIGSIGTSEVAYVFREGPVGVISKSGGMTAEIASTLTRHKIGQSTVVGIGGDTFIGSDFVDILRLFQKDRQTKAIVMFGEIGGTYEEQAASYIQKEKFKKPVIALIAGAFSEHLPQDTVLGHAGAIVSRGKGSYQSKVRSLSRAGVRIARSVDEIPLLIKKSLSH